MTGRGYVITCLPTTVAAGVCHNIVVYSANKAQSRDVNAAASAICDAVVFGPVCCVRYSRAAPTRRAARAQRQGQTNVAKKLF